MAVPGEGGGGGGARWAGILLNWINCYEIQVTDIGHLLTDNSILTILNKLHPNTDSTTIESQRIDQFIIDKYPQFKFVNGNTQPLTEDDVVMATSLLLLYVCVQSKDVDLKNAMCNKLSRADQHVILKFTKSLISCKSVTYGDVRAAIIESCGQDYPLLTCDEPVGSTPPPLRALHGEVRRLRAALDAERFDRLYLQDELTATCAKVEKLIKDKEHYQKEILSLKSQLAEGASELECSQDGSPTKETARKVLARQLFCLEERLVDTQGRLEECETERNTLNAKIEELKVDRDKWVQFGQQESARAFALTEQLDDERKTSGSLRELVGELQAHQKKNNHDDSSLLECDDDVGNRSFQDTSVCGDICASVVEVQLCEERARISHLTRQLQALDDKVKGFEKNQKEVKTMILKQRELLQSQVKGSEIFYDSSDDSLEEILKNIDITKLSVETTEIDFNALPELERNIDISMKLHALLADLVRHLKSDIDNKRDTINEQKKSLLNTEKLLQVATNNQHKIVCNVECEMESYNKKDAEFKNKYNKKLDELETQIDSLKRLIQIISDHIMIKINEKDIYIESLNKALEKQSKENIVLEMMFADEKFTYQASLEERNNLINNLQLQITQEQNLIQEFQREITLLKDNTVSQEEIIATLKENLQKEMEEKLIQIDNLHHKIKKLSDNINENGKIINMQESELHNVIMKNKDLIEENQALEIARDNLSAEIKEKVTIISFLTEKKNDLLKNIDMKEELIHKITQQYDNCISEKQVLEESRDNLYTEISETANTITILTEEKKNLLKNIEMKEELIHKMTQEYDDYIKQRQALEEARDNLYAEIMEKSETITVLRDEKNNLHKALETKQDLILNMTQQYEEISIDNTSKESTIVELQNSLASLQNMINVIEQNTRDTVIKLNRQINDEKEIMNTFKEEKEAVVSNLKKDNEELVKKLDRIGQWAMELEKKLDNVNINKDCILIEKDNVISDIQMKLDHEIELKCKAIEDKNNLEKKLESNEILLSEIQDKLQIEVKNKTDIAMELKDLNILHEGILKDINTKYYKVIEENEHLVQILQEKELLLTENDHNLQALSKENEGLSNNIQELKNQNVIKTCELNDKIHKDEETHKYVISQLNSIIESKGSELEEKQYMLTENYHKIQALSKENEELLNKTEVLKTQIEMNTCEFNDKISKEQENHEEMMSKLNGIIASKDRELKKKYSVLAELNDNLQNQIHKNKEVSMVVHELNNMEKTRSNELISKDTILSEVSHKLKSANNEKENLEKEKIALHKELKQKEQIIEKSSSEFNLLKELHTRVASKKAGLEAQVRENDQAISGLKKTIMEKDEAITALKIEISQLENAITSKDKIIADLSNNLALKMIENENLTKESDEKLANYNSVIENINSEIQQNHKLLNEHKEEIKAIKELVASKTALFKFNLDSSCHKETTKEENIDNTIMKTESILEFLSREFECVIREKEIMLTQFREQINSLEEEVQHKNDKINELTNKIKEDIIACNSLHTKITNIHTELEASKKSAEVKFNEYENTISQNQQLIEILQNEVYKSENEVDEIKKLYEEMKGNYESDREVQRKNIDGLLKEAQDNINNLQADVKRKDDEIFRILEDNKSAKEKLDYATEELNSVSNILHTRKDESEDLCMLKNSMTAIILESNDYLNNIIKAIELFATKYSLVDNVSIHIDDKVENVASNFDKMVTRYKNIIHILKTELDSSSNNYNTVLLEKANISKEVVSLKAEYERNMSNLKDQLSDKKALVSHLEKDIALMREDKITIINNLTCQLDREKSDNAKIIAENKTQIEVLKLKLENLEKEKDIINNEIIEKENYTKEKLEFLEKSLAEKETLSYDVRDITNVIQQLHLTCINLGFIETESASNYSSNSDEIALLKHQIVPRSLCDEEKIQKSSQKTNSILEEDINRCVQRGIIATKAVHEAITKLNIEIENNKKIKEELNVKNNLIQSLETNVANVELKLDEMTAKQKELQVHSDRMATIVKVKEVVLEDTTTKLNELENVVIEKENANVKLNEMVRDLNNNIVELTMEKDKIIESKETELEVLKNNINEIETKNAQLSKIISEMKHKTETISELDESRFKEEITVKILDELKTLVELNAAFDLEDDDGVEKILQIIYNSENKDDLVSKVTQSFQPLLRTLCMAIKDLKIRSKSLADKCKELELENDSKIKVLTKEVAALSKSIAHREDLVNDVKDERERDTTELQKKIDLLSLNLMDTSGERNQTISNLEKIVFDKNRIITALQTEITYLKNLIADSGNKVLDMNKELEESRATCHQLSSQLKRTVFQKNEEIADLKRQLSKMCSHESSASQIIKVSAKYQAIILKRIAEIKSNTALRELTHLNNVDDNRKSLIDSVTTDDLENFLESTEKHLRKLTEKQTVLQKERDRFAEISKINESETISLKKYLTELLAHFKTFSSIKDVYNQKLSKVISLQRMIRREIHSLDQTVSDSIITKLERSYGVVMQDLCETALNLGRWSERCIDRSISPEKLKQAFSSETPTLSTSQFQNTGLEVQIEELMIAFKKVYEEVIKAKKGEVSKEPDVCSVMEVRAEYEDKLNRMKAKMKQLYQEQIAVYREKQKEEMLGLEREVERSRTKLEEKSKAYEEHIQGLTKELWSVGEKFLMKKEEAEWLRRKQSSSSLMSLQHVHSSGVGREREHAGPSSRTSDVHSLQSFPAHKPSKPSKPSKPANSEKGFHMSDEEGEVFDNRWLKELNTTPRPEHSSHRASERFSELKYRNSLCPPHLKSSYPAETQFHPKHFNEDDIKFEAGSERRKEVGITAYKKPGPPTPSKSAGRLSATDSELRESLRPEPEAPLVRKTTTPSRLRALFRSNKSDAENTGTPRSKRLSIFRSRK